MRANKRNALSEFYRERIRNIYENTTRFHWTHEKLVNSLSRCIWEEKDYQSLPRYEREFLAGYQRALDENMRRQQVYSYMIVYQGKTIRATIESEEYRSVSAQEICEKYLDTGCFVWRDAPEKRFTNPKRER